MAHKLKILLIFMLGCCIAACKNREVPAPDSIDGKIQSEKVEVQPDTQDILPGEEKNRENILVQGSTGELIYEVEYEERIFEAEDGTSIFEARLAYPVLIGKTDNILRINDFFVKWKEEKFREYETDDDSVWHSALEVYRESRNFGWMGPWSEEYEVTSINSQYGYVSVLLDSYLYEGGSHGIPYRESFLFRKKDGHSVSLMVESGMTKEQWEEMLENRFRVLVQEDNGKMFYKEAEELLDDIDWDEVGAYFGDSGIVFYLPPYEIGPYTSGYAEVTFLYEEIFGTNHNGESVHTKDVRR